MAIVRTEETRGMDARQLLTKLNAWNKRAATNQEGTIIARHDGNGWVIVAGKTIRDEWAGLSDLCIDGVTLADIADRIVWTEIYPVIAAL